MISDDKVVYVAFKNGSIKYFPIKEMNEENIFSISEPNTTWFKSILLLSKDKCFLVRYVDVDDEE